VSERRLVSVLFADLVGFTTLSETRDAEDVRDLLGRYFETCRQLITRYGGTVEKFIGDAVMAVWGTPVAQEDDAERAVRTALDLVAAVAHLGVDVGAPDLRARAGVLTGEAAVTIGAEGQGMVAGDLVNSASRVQSVAEPGSVLVGESTRRATEAAIAYEEAGVHTLKGKAEPVALHRATRVVALRGGALKSTALEAPFVGRDRELRLLKELFHDAVDKRRAHLLSVIGIAGIGKSRLSWEFFKYIDGLAEAVWWHRGRSLAYGEGIAFWALAEMVKMRCRIAEDEAPDSARDKLRQTLEDVVPDADERRWMEPRLAHLLGLEDWAARDQQDLFSAWRMLFERLGDQGPAVLVFEDMQWADKALIDFIEYLMEWSRNYPLFVVTMGRPELLERRPDWGAGRRDFTSMYLEPLSEPAMWELLSGLVPGLADDIGTKILDRAEGVPLYAMETVRMLLDRELLVREGNVYRPSGPIDTLEVPETLLALIAARLDGLTTEERRLVQDGAVLGKTFTIPGLSSLTGLPEEQLQPLLASLVRKEVLSLQADPTSPERGQYGFLQDLVRKVAYDTLSKKERKAKQLAAATFIEQTWTGDEDEIVEVVAAHYVAAYREAPEDADADLIRDKTRDMLVRAGERAASLAATAEAQKYFTEAAGLTGDPLERARLHERAGQMALQDGRLDEARGLFESAMGLFEAGGASHAAARITARLGDVDWIDGHLAEAIDRMEEALPILLQGEPDEDLAMVAAQLGRLHFFRGEMDIALERLETALRIAEPMGWMEVVSQALNSKSVVFEEAGRQEEAAALLERALAVALEHDYPAAALRAYNNLAENHFRRDRPEVAAGLHEDGLALARRVGNSLWEGLLSSEICYPLFVLGRWDEAVARANEIPDEARTRADALGQLLVMPALHAARGELEEAQRVLEIFTRFEDSADVQERAAHAVARAVVHGASGRHEKSLEAAVDAAKTGRSIGPDGHMFKLGVEHAIDAALALGDHAAVEKLLAMSDELRPAEMTPMLQAIATRGRARLAWSRGEVEGVEAGLKEAAGLFREIGAVPWLAAALADLGTWLVEHGKEEGGQSAAREAAEIYERLGAKVPLAKLRGRIDVEPAPIAAIDQALTEVEPTSRG
jgi:class 3 adenylate cyclase/predicted ATPase